METNSSEFCLQIYHQNRVWRHTYNIFINTVSFLSTLVIHLLRRNIKPICFPLIAFRVPFMNVFIPFSLRLIPSEGLSFPFSTFLNVDLFLSPGSGRHLVLLIDSILHRNIYIIEALYAPVWKAVTAEYYPLTNTKKFLGEGVGSCIL